MWLYERVANALNDDENETKIPPYITQNLSKELREYQQNALKHFLRQRKFRNDKTNHLLFNMATGSGKTLMMAALMIECFKLGYRNFVFFVNSLSVLEKTKDNFINATSSKYLFAKRVQIDGKSVEINAINNLSESKEGCINILFSTIQSLFSLFKEPREGCLTYDDLVGEKLVFLADEAHHLNADTKRNAIERDIKEGWEGVIMKAFDKNPQNLMLEFTATLPKENEVLEKYEKKVVYKYDLKEFSKDGFAKKIFLMKYESRDLKARFLGAMILSLYREFLALDSGIKSEFAFKPVILFKSESIKESLKNQGHFLALVENLNDGIIKEFFSVKSDASFFKDAHVFFTKKWGEGAYINLARYLQDKFKSEYIINTNDEKELGKNQILLNSLENNANSVRVIFSVDKLNEGWDVLNLFDIVRLNDKSASGAVTTREAQLIGRGARYFPFSAGSFDEPHQRKFDSDASNPLAILETMSYHTINDSKFISDLNKELKESGLVTIDSTTIVRLEANEKVKKMIKGERIKYVEFSKNLISKQSLFDTSMESVGEKIGSLQVPLFSQDREGRDMLGEDEEAEVSYKNKTLEIIESKFFYKAMNMLGMSFEKISSVFDVKSKEEFVRDFLHKKSVDFDERQRFDRPHLKLEIAKFVLENAREKMEVLEKSYEVNASVKELDMGDFDGRSVLSKKAAEVTPYAWLYHKNALLDSGDEKEFLKFIDKHKEKLDKKFEKWFMIRNDGFGEFKIYDYRKNEKTYANGFEPDFVLFGKKKDGEFFGIECFMEVKGEIYAHKDAWKEQLLALLDDDAKNQKEPLTSCVNFRILGLPFYNPKEKSKFEEAFKKAFE